MNRILLQIEEVRRLIAALEGGTAPAILAAVAALQARLDRLQRRMVAELRNLADD